MEVLSMQLGNERHHIVSVTQNAGS